MKTLQNTIKALALGVLAVSTMAVSCKGAVTTDPTTDQVQQVRLNAVRAADATTAGLKIIQEVDELAQSLPIPVATKDAIDCGVIKVTGTTAPPSAKVIEICKPHVGDLPNGPGPLHLALDQLKNVSTQPSLQTTARAVLDAVKPLIAKLDASDNQSLRFAGMSIRTALAYLGSL